MFVDPTGLVSYLLYDPNEFGSQVESEEMRLRENFGTQVYAFPVTTEAEFIRVWNLIGDDGQHVDSVSLLFHSNPLAIMIDYQEKEYITVNASGFTESGADATYIGNRDVLEFKTMTKLYLQCNSGHLDYKDTNLAATFLREHNISEVIAWDGGTGYTSYMYLEQNGVPRTYYHQRLANNRNSFNHFVRYGARNPVGRVRYTKNGIEVLGNPTVTLGEYVDGKQLYGRLQ